MVLELSKADRRELEARVRARNLRAEDQRRARTLLMLADGNSYREIQTTIGCSSAYIARWCSRYESEGLAGLHGRHFGRKAAVLTPKLQARILEKTRQKPSDGTTHWSTRRLAKALGLNHMLVARTWAQADLKPHRYKRYMASDDPDFETKAADVIGLYLKPPQHAAVFCVDEKTAIQALDRLDPVLPFSPGRIERHGFEYRRNGTLSLYAALNTASGQVLGKTAARHTSEQFVAFLGDLIASQPAGKEIHVVADNLSAHKTQRVRDFLHQNPSVHLHFTPTYSSWLNQVENWFSRLERQLIERGIFKSVADLDRKIMRFIRHYNKTARHIKWKYRDVTKRIETNAVDSSVTGN